MPKTQVEPLPEGTRVRFTDAHVESLRDGLAPFLGAIESVQVQRMTVENTLPNGRVNVTYIGPSGHRQYRTVGRRQIQVA
jgi:hypothetical protein